jgi:hypothetical protein
LRILLIVVFAIFFQELVARTVFSRVIEDKTYSIEWSEVCQCYGFNFIYRMWPKCLLRPSRLITDEFNHNSYCLPYLAIAYNTRATCDHQVICVRETNRVMFHSFSQSYLCFRLRGFRSRSARAHDSDHAEYKGVCSIQCE